MWVAFSKRRSVGPKIRIPGPKRCNGALAVLYVEPETSRFLAAVERLKREHRRKQKQTRLAKQRVRAVLRKMREC
jgi:hypothetical protein